LEYLYVRTAASESIPAQGELRISHLRAKTSPKNNITIPEIYLLYFNAA
jgi:hypothetical protein